MLHIVKELAALREKGNNFLKFMGSHVFLSHLSKNFKNVTSILRHKNQKRSQDKVSTSFIHRAPVTRETQGLRKRWLLKAGEGPGGGAGVAKKKTKQNKTTQNPAPRCFTALAPPLQGREADAGKHGRHLFSRPGFHYPGRVTALALRQLGR